MSVRSFMHTFSLLLATTLLLTSCFSLGQSAPTQVADVEYTMAAETIVAELTLRAPQLSATDLVQTIQSAAPTKEASLSIEPTETLPPTSTPVPSETPLPTETPTPEGTPTLAFTSTPAWNLVFQDNLKSGLWITDKTDLFRLQYSNGGYMITNHIDKDIAYSVRNDKYSQVRIEVTGERVSGPVNGYYGIICNFKNGGNYYFLGVGQDGWYGIGMKQGGSLRFLEEGYDNNGAIRVTNLLRADCLNGTLTLSANGVELATVKDFTIESGLIGVGVGNRNITGAEAVFSDFMVYELKP
jgi:hypothetical protein